MAARTSIALALALALASTAGCGGAGAALQITQYPGDRDASPRRLEALAREFENTFGCTETDTIQITGIQPGIYNVQGCTGIRDYMLSCRPGPYGQICSWAALPDVAQQAAVDLNCQPAMLDIQLGAPNQRAVEGCGLRAVYMMSCGGGGCAWMMSGPVQQSTGVAGGSYVQ